MPLDTARRAGQVFGMKLWPLIIGSCCILAGGCTLPTDSKPSASTAAQPQAAAAALVAGKYSGDWTNTDGTTGTLQLTLTKPDNSPWQASVTFNYNGNDATTTMRSVAVNDTQILLAYDYNIQDTEGAVEMTGKLAGNTLQGSFKITKGDGAPGTWQATRVQ